MKDVHIVGKKMARNGPKTVDTFSVSFRISLYSLNWGPTRLGTLLRFYMLCAVNPVLTFTQTWNIAAFATYFSAFQKLFALFKFSFSALNRSGPLSD